MKTLAKLYRIHCNELKGGKRIEFSICDDHRDESIESTNRLHSDGVTLINSLGDIHSLIYQLHIKCDETIVKKSQPELDRILIDGTPVAGRFLYDAERRTILMFCAYSVLNNRKNTTHIMLNLRFVELATEPMPLSKLELSSPKS